LNGVTQTGTLDLLISLAEDLPKLETFFTATVAKTVDTLRNLLNSDPSKLAQHILVNEQRVDDYLLKGWKWNEGRYGINKGLRDMVDVLSKVVRCRTTLRSTDFGEGNDIDRQHNETEAQPIQYSEGFVASNATQETVGCHLRC
jgi:V-type H+-transporting ATPase subunit C